ncbi:MAG: murein transglycosylase, partial [Cypionkella sp.]
MRAAHLKNTLRQQLRTLAVGAALLAVLGAAQPAIAVTCSDTSQGFEAWKAATAAQAQAQGVGARGLAALAGASYSQPTISADRNQKSFKYPLDQFLRLRGANDIAA